MNKLNTKFAIKNVTKTRQYINNNNNKKYYYYKKIQYDNYDNYHYSLYRRKKNISYINYNNFYNKEEEEKSFEKETKESNKTPSTKDNSVDKSTETNSRKQSFNNNYNVNCTDGNNDNNKECNVNNKLNGQKKDDVIKINLSNNEIESAFFKPKNYMEKKENNFKKNNFENTVILEINVKMDKNKILYFKLRRFDDMFLVIKDICVKNELNEYFTNFFVYTIIKALNSIYGIYNIKLKEDEIKFLKDLKKKM